MTTQQIPTSKAKTAFGLLSEIRALILAEPKRYDQTDTLSLRENYPDADATAFPACGTVGCVAGWTVALKAESPNRVVGVMRFAQTTLGLSEFQADELFDGGAARGSTQTRAHARSGAAHIKRFQQAHRAQLLAKKV